MGTGIQVGECAESISSHSICQLSSLGRLEGGVRFERGVLADRGSATRLRPISSRSFHVWASGHIQSLLFQLSGKTENIDWPANYLAICEVLIKVRDHFEFEFHPFSQVVRGLGFSKIWKAKKLS